MTPDTVEYIAYLVPVEQVVRVGNAWQRGLAPLKGKCVCGAE